MVRLLNCPPEATSCWLLTFPLGKLQIAVFPGGAGVKKKKKKKASCSAEDTRNISLIPRSGRSLGEGNGNPLQCSCLENPMDRGPWWATVPRVRKSWTRLRMHKLLSSKKGHKRLRFYVSSHFENFLFSLTHPSTCIDQAPVSEFR